ncbi:putative small lipoprotein YifL [Siphonobacter sp. BAB-5404]|nr:putative small lipoprotein YifL [Siphonobacter sp. SORGH_AS_1065]MDR6196299.1 putative small lipoprotein YifL [Siphonobacter sp. SORGH_AS_0500]
MKIYYLSLLLLAGLTSCAGCSKTGNHRHRPDSTQRN